MISDPPIRVMLVDDHAMVRRGLATFLQVFADLELAGEAVNGEEAIELCASTQPDVILMDMVMPDMDGASVTKIIREKFPQVQVIVLTSFKETALVQSALHAGAIGYLLKDVTADELANTIRAAHAGQVTLGPAAVQAMVRAAQSPPPPGADLTPREVMVLKLMVDGLSNKEIAKVLVIGPGTVKTHVSHILRKLEASSRTEAVALAIRHHLIG